MSAWLRTNIEVFENGFRWVSVLKRERKLVAQEGGWELSLWKIHLDFIHENGTPTRSHQLFLCVGATVLTVHFSFNTLAHRCVCMRVCTCARDIESTFCWD